VNNFADMNQGDMITLCNRLFAENMDLTIEVYSLLNLVNGCDNLTELRAKAEFIRESISERKERQRAESVLQG